MNKNPTFILDANVFIEASMHYYSFDIAPRFWDSLIEFNERGRVFSIDRVKNELDKGNNTLSNWADNHFTQAFISTDQEEVFIYYRKVMNWVQNQSQYRNEAKADFAKGADGWVISYSMLKGFTVVTHEKPAPFAKKKVPIPNVCGNFNVPIMNTFQMLTSLGVQFT